MFFRMCCWVFSGELDFLRLRIRFFVEVLFGLLLIWVFVFLVLVAVVECLELRGEAEGLFWY